MFSSAFAFVSFSLLPALIFSWIDMLSSVFVGVFLLVCGLKLVTFKCFLLFFVFGGCLEQFVARVFQGGKVTVPKRLRELLGIQDGDYVRLGIVEVVKPKVKRRV